MRAETLETKQNKATETPTSEANEVSNANIYAWKEGIES